MNYDFDASQYAPRQTMGAHPVGKFPMRVTAVEGKPTKDGGGGYIAVTFTTAAGSIVKRYNVWSTNQQAVDIAHGELSALGYAVGVLRWSLRDGGKALIGAQGQIEVGVQIDKQTGQPNANGYVEVKKVYDIHGNDPTQPLQQAPQPLPVHNPPLAHGQPFPIDNAPQPASPFGQPQPQMPQNPSPPSWANQAPTQPATSPNWNSPAPAQSPPQAAPQPQVHNPPPPYHQPGQSQHFPATASHPAGQPFPIDNAPQPSPGPSWANPTGAAAPSHQAQPQWSQQAQPQGGMPAWSQPRQ